MNDKMHPDREDEQNVSYAESLGWTVDRSRQYQMGLVFIRGNERVWQIMKGGRVAWQAARVVDGMYVYHRPQTKLRDALTYGAAK